MNAKGEKKIIGKLEILRWIPRRVQINRGGEVFELLFIDAQREALRGLWGLTVEAEYDPLKMAGDNVSGNLLAIKEWSK